MAGQLLTLACSALLLAPWALLCAALLPRGTLPERLAVGAALGLGASVTLAYALAAFGQLDAFLWVFAVVCVGALIAWRKRPHTGPAEEASAAESIGLGLAAALVAAFASIPTFASQVPIGWDPSFHAILAEKVRLTGALPTSWEPFEPIAVNYPLGSHLWVALLANLAGEPVHHVFQLQHLVVQTLAAVLVYALAKRMLDDWRSGVFAMLCYGLLGNWGTFYSYYQWGGLPTELACVLFLALLWSALALRGAPQRVLGVVCYGSMLLVHHLGALIATLVLGGYIALALVCRARDGLWQRLTWVGIATALSYAAFVVPYATKAAELTQTDALQFAEEPRLSLLTLVDNLGLAIVLLGAFGLWKVRAVAGAGVSLLLAWAAVLALAYTGLDYGYRLFANLAWSLDVTAFTPSRLATLLSYPLCIAAGATLEAARCALAARLGARDAGARLSGEAASVCLFAALAAALALPRALGLAELRAFDPMAEQAGAWVRRGTPEDAFVLYRQPIAPPRWIPYLTWRASLHTPIPASENRRAVERRRDALLQAASDPSRLAAKLSELGKRGFVLSVDAQGKPRLEPIR